MRLLSNQGTCWLARQCVWGRCCRDTSAWNASGREASHLLERDLVTARCWNPAWEVRNRQTGGMRSWCSRRRPIGWTRFASHLPPAAGGLGSQRTTGERGKQLRRERTCFSVGAIELKQRWIAGELLRRMCRGGVVRAGRVRVRQPGRSANRRCTGSTSGCVGTVKLSKKVQKSESTLRR